jgi:hypothetical protein
MAATTPPGAESEARDSWAPMIVIAMGQALMLFNVAAIPVSMVVMVASPTGEIMLAAQDPRRSRKIFRQP